MKSDVRVLAPTSIYIFEAAAVWKVFGKHARTLMNQSGETYLSLRRLQTKGKTEAAKTDGHQSFRLSRNLLLSDFFFRQHFVSEFVSLIYV